jgi:hypothetical protein
MLEILDLKCQSIQQYLEPLIIVPYDFSRLLFDLFDLNDACDFDLGS